jgi:uncharacterized membrane protein
MDNPTGLEEEAKLRPIRKKEQAFLTRELEHWRWLNLLDDRQASAIAALYEPARERFLQVFMGLGAMLVGLGLLSYIAANWMDLGRALKVAIIIGGYALSMAAAYRFEPSYPHGARAFLLIGGFAYGAGIFLIAQMFHEGGAITDALFWWIAGIAPACLLFKDRMQLLLIQAISLVYFYFQCFSSGWRFLGYHDAWASPWSWWSLYMFLRTLAYFQPLAVLAGIWLLWRYGARWRTGLHVNVFITMNYIGINASRYIEFTMVLFMFFIAGLLLCATSPGRRRNSMEDWGVALVGVLGLTLSYPVIWRGSRIMASTNFWGLRDFCLSALNAQPETAFAVTVAILACAALILRVYAGSQLAASFFCLMILRFYFDVFYDFMDKALYFTTGGLLLIAMGFYLQRVRKKRKEAELS